MNYTKAPSLFVVVLVGILGCAPGRAARPGAREASSSRSATPPAQTPPEGRLGLPLGTVARIRAVVVLGQDVNYKLYTHRFLLRVTHVNGREVAGTPVLEFHVPAFIAKELADSASELYEMKHGQPEQPLTAQQIDSLERGYVGRKFALDVYEEGKFSGIPDDLPADVPSWQGQGFGFHTWLMVVAER